MSDAFADALIALLPPVSLSPTSPQE